MYVLSGALNVTAHKQMVLQRLTQAGWWHILSHASCTVQYIMRDILCMSIFIITPSRHEPSF